jgi:hypothetical protein
MPTQSICYSKTFQVPKTANLIKRAKEEAAKNKTKASWTRVVSTAVHHTKLDYNFLMNHLN